MKIVNNFILLSCITLFSWGCTTTSTVQQSSFTPQQVDFPTDMPLNQRIAYVAQFEHQLWYQPFINKQGHMLKSGIGEAEKTKLKNKQMVWQRVASYWNLPKIENIAQIKSCAMTENQANKKTLSEADTYRCRSLLIDTPWSAAFVSYVMTQAGVKDFTISAAHIDYIRSAWLKQGAYHLQTPEQMQAKVGDLLCYSRDKNVQDYATLLTFLEHNPDQFLQTHCDIVVDVDQQNSEISVIGGNVANSVVLRKLPLTSDGYVQFPVLSPEKWCDMQQQDYCNMNRRSYIAWLQFQAVTK